jgi:hypothetical protein
MSAALAPTAIEKIIPSFTVITSGGSQTFGSELDIVKNATAYGTGDGVLNKYVVPTSVPMAIENPLVRAWQGVGLGTFATRQMDFAVMNASDTEVVSAGRTVKYVYIFFAPQLDTQFAVRLFNADKEAVPVTNPGTTFVSDTDWTLECVGNVLLFSRSADTITSTDSRVFVKLAADTTVNLAVIAEAYKKPYIQAVVTYDNDNTSPFILEDAWRANASASTWAPGSSPAPASGSASGSGSDSTSDSAPASAFKYKTTIIVITVIAVLVVIASIIAIVVTRSPSDAATPTTPTGTPSQ